MPFEWSACLANTGTDLKHCSLSNDALRSILDRAHKDRNGSVFEPHTTFGFLSLWYNRPDKVIYFVHTRWTWRNDFFLSVLERLCISVGSPVCLSFFFFFAFDWNINFNAGLKLEHEIQVALQSQPLWNEHCCRVYFFHETHAQVQILRLMSRL